jgi:hypothetical protein
MRRRLFMPALALAVVGCQAGLPLSDENLGAIADVRQVHADAVLAGDAAAVAALYTEDAVEMPPKLPATEGRAAIQARYEAVVPEYSYLPLILDDTASLGESGRFPPLSRNMAPRRPSPNAHAPTNTRCPVVQHPSPPPCPAQMALVADPEHRRRRCKTHFRGSSSVQS